MCQGYRLCLLQMGKARHISMHILFHDLLKSLKKCLHLLVNGVNLIAHIQLHIQRHLIITASSGVKLLAWISDSVNEIGLHKAMNILVFRCDRKSACLYICKDSFKSFKDLVSFFFCQNALFGKHFYMCLAAADILLIKFLIK